MRYGFFVQGLRKVKGEKMIRGLITDELGNFPGARREGYFISRKLSLVG